MRWLLLGTALWCAGCGEDAPCVQTAGVSALSGLYQIEQNLTNLDTFTDAVVQRIN